jgi:hypothetical protein
MTEYELFKLLRTHFPPREFAPLPQVGNATGFGTPKAQEKEEGKA